MPDDLGIKLSDPDLFGNDAAEDEEEDVFAGYALTRPEVATFVAPSNKICVARAYKGEGKSALLRMAEAEIREKERDQALLISRTASAFMPDTRTDDLPTAVKAWKAALLKTIAGEVGRQIDFAWDDDGMSLVEEAERQGFRKRNLVSAVLDRIGAIKLSAAGVGQVEARVEKKGAGEPEGVLKRWASGRSPIWFIVDDVDQDFRNTRENRVRVAAFFVACRDLVKSIPQVRVRAAVRPNVWTILKLEHEALSHVEQYMTDLTWTEGDARQLIAKRVQGYLERRGKWEQAKRALPTVSGDGAEKALIAKVFEGAMEWGKTTRPPHVLLYTLSKHRPRWIIELSKVAARRASARGAHVIGKSDLTADLLEFGRRRIQDTVAEFKAQCAEVEEIISAFARGSEEMNTDALLDVIERKVLTHLNPGIAGVTGQARSLDVAAFLFQVGFIYARRDLPGGEYEHYAFADRPSLLRSRADVDASLRWEIHPVFRQALEIRDSSGFETRRDQRARRG